MPKSKKKTGSPEYDKLLKSLKDDIVTELKGQLEKKLESIKNDLSADISERIKRIPPPPAVAPKPGVDLQGMMSALQGGDLSEIAGLIPQAAPVPTAETLQKMTPEQLDYQKNQQMMGMVTAILPKLLGAGGGNSQIMNEMMTRMFMENILQSTNMTKALTAAVFKKFGVDGGPLETNLMTPISDQLKKTAIGTPGSEQTGQGN